MVSGNGSVDTPPTPIDDDKDKRVNARREMGLVEAHA
jgi:hypothetical protein